MGENNSSLVSAFLMNSENYVTLVIRSCEHCEVLRLGVPEKKTLQARSKSWKRVSGPAKGSDQPQLVIVAQVRDRSSFPALQALASGIC